VSHATARDRETDARSSVDLSPLRLGALLSALLVMASFLTAVYHVVDVIGDPADLIYVVAAALLAATVLSRLLSVRSATLLATGLLVVGIAWYLSVLPVEDAFAFVAHVEYIVALLAGHSVLEIVNLRAWVLAVTPGPVFLLWYLALRRRYAAAATIGGLAVGFFVLTGDATLPVAIVGTVGTLALVGFGALDRAGAETATGDVVAIVLTVVIVLSLTVSIVPQGAAMTYSPKTGLGEAFSYSDGNTLETNLLSANQRMSISGSIELSSTVRWTVQSEQPRYWRVAAYDLYTGDGWVRRAEARRDGSALGTPQSSSRRITQRFTAESRINTMPAAWRPTAIGGEVGANALVSDFGGLQPRNPLEEGDSYTVESALVDATPRELQRAGTDYPDRIASRYRQLPDSMPDRVSERTATLTSRAETPYETAIIVEDWLRSEYEYSLDVPRPSGTVADTFLFEMNRGYCTYFATTMAVMLRSQGIPARMVVGYTPGERVEDNEWVVRGYNSHAWVEVYFPEVGWVKFDPTPPGPRQEAEQERLSDARQENEPNVDPDNPSYTPQPTTPPTTTPSAPEPNETTTPAGSETPETAEPAPAPSTNSGSGPQLPSREGFLLGMIAVFGLVATARRSGVSSRLYRAAWIRWQPRVDPETDVDRAYERLEYVLEREHRPRATGETRRQYLDAVDADDRAREIAAIHERAHYAGDVDEGAADRAVELVDGIVSDR
jgi:transglutaminase-like putative cysteine protease